MIRAYKNIQPIVSPSAYIDEQACVIGEVSIGDNSSVWPMAVLRGDVQAIEIGHSTNIQDGTVCHVTHRSQFNPDGYPLIIGDEVTVGHKALLHACVIGSQCLIGMGAIVMDGAVIEPRVLLAAGSVVPPNKKLESGFLYRGSPAQKIRALTEDELNYFHYSAQHYVKLMGEYTAC